MYKHNLFSFILVYIIIFALFYSTLLLLMVLPLCACIYSLIAMVVQCFCKTLVLYYWYIEKPHVFSELYILSQYHVFWFNNTKSKFTLGSVVRGQFYGEHYFILSYIQTWFVSLSRCVNYHFVNFVFYVWVNLAHRAYDRPLKRHIPI